MLVVCRAFKTIVKWLISSITISNRKTHSPLNERQRHVCDKTLQINKGPRTSWRDRKTRNVRKTKHSELPTIYLEIAYFDPSTFLKLAWKPFILGYKWFGYWLIELPSLAATKLLQWAYFQTQNFGSETRHLINIHSLSQNLSRHI